MSPLPASGSLHGLQLWVALPESARNGANEFGHHADLPHHRDTTVDATVLVGTLGGVTSPATAYSPLAGAQLDLAPGAAILDLDPAFEHAVLLGGAPWTEPLVMWWNFVAREHDEIVAARAAWEARDPRFGEVAGPLDLHPPAPLIVRERGRNRRTRGLCGRELRGGTAARQPVDAVDIGHRQRVPAVLQTPPG